jgi:hypothetical protein
VVQSEGRIPINITRLTALQPVARGLLRLMISSVEVRNNGMKLTRAAFILILLPVLCGAVSAQDKHTGQLKGKVKVEKGSPGGVAVILRQGEREVTRVSTDRKGNFLISRIAPGFYGVTFRKPGLAIESIEKLEVKAGKTRSLSDLILPVDEGSIAFIRGSVFNEAGRSVPNVRVELSRIVSDSHVENLDARMTGETGEFVFRVPPDVAKYRLTLRSEGAEAVSKDVEVDGASVFRLALTLKPIRK